MSSNFVVCFVLIASISVQPLVVAYRLESSMKRQKLFWRTRTSDFGIMSGFVFRLKIGAWGIHTNFPEHETLCLGLP